MIEGPPDAFVTPVARLPRRNDDVDEWVAVWRARRPEGASPVVRLAVERALPTCYPLLFPTQLQDPAVRAFSSWRAIRCGVDGAEPWAVLPHAPGVSAHELLDALGEGHAAIEVVLHVANELVQQLDLLELQRAQVRHDDAGGLWTSWEPGRSTLLVRPFDERHVHVAFDGDVSFDVVTDKLQLERPAFELVRDELVHEARRGQEAARRVPPRVVSRLLQGAPAELVRDDALDAVRGALFSALVGGTTDARDALASEPRVPAGRAALRDMLRALFPERWERARDLAESALV